MNGQEADRGGAWREEGGGAIVGSQQDLVVSSSARACIRFASLDACVDLYPAERVAEMRINATRELSQIHMSTQGT